MGQIIKTLEGTLAAAALLAGGALGGIAQASENGMSSQQITFGQSAALEGSASALGKGMHLGIEAAFAQANADGGVHGRKLTLQSHNDGYEPDAAIENTRKFITDNNVFALIGAVGTPTSKAAQPITTEAGMPYIGPFTGAGFLRDPAHGNVVNYRASYAQETEAWIKHLTEDLGYSKIAILYQDDSFGRVGLNGVNAALDKRGMKLVAEGTYTRNTVAVKGALLRIRKANPEAVVMVGAYKPIAEFIRLAKKVKMDATFVNISFVGSRALADELGADGEGVVITQVVPYPWDDSLGVVADYHKALAILDKNAEPGFVSLEGYLVGRMTIEALKRAGANPSRQDFLNAFYNGAPMDLGGITLTFGSQDTQGSDAVYLTMIDGNGGFTAVDKLVKP